MANRQEKGGWNNSKKVDDSPLQPLYSDNGYNWGLHTIPKALLYIDNSNIFESAKKHSGHKKGYRNAIPDVACRIDIGKLIAKAVGNRELVFGKLYGSEPPALDSVWEAIRRKQVHVETFQRSKWTLKEKETDSSLTADAVEDIIMNQDSAGLNRTLILFSGDRDLMRVVDKAIKFGYKVEIWSFKTSINNAVKRKANDEKPQSLKVFYIDDIFDEITYTKVVWGKQKIPRERSLVTPISLPIGTDKKKFLSEFVAKSGDIFQLPMMGKYLEDYHYIVLVPCIKEHYHSKSKSERAPPIRTYDYYKHVQPFTHMLEEHYQTQNIGVKIQTWVEFLATRRSAKDQNLNSENRFQYLSNDDDEEEEEDAESGQLSDDESEDFDSTEFYDCHPEELSDDEFTPIISKETKPRRQYSEECHHKFWCVRGLACSYKHSDQQREFFQVQPDAKKRHLYKIKPCYREFQAVCNYKNKPYLCGYAHNLEESRCLCCKQQRQRLWKTLDGQMS